MEGVQKVENTWSVRKGLSKRLHYFRLRGEKVLLFPDRLKVAENGGSGAGKHYAPELQDQDKG